MHRRLAPGLLALALITGASLAAEQITVYRCTDAQGRVSLRDTPCRKGETQAAREMLKPQDPPSRRTPPAPARAPETRPAPAVPQRPLMLVAPRPLYECVTPDGRRYVTETGEGNPRWVPWWTLGYPVLIPRNPLGDRVGAPVARPGDPPIAVVYGHPGGTWVRDECHPLPQAEVCARLSERRSEIERRYFNAMPSEREELRAERRGIDARLANDCGIG